ncbi:MULTISPECIES: HAMP domain-containing sensor histidine kinase [unclassified Streptomyces]|uniref:sensor histidine kinase n=1 Tax=unclassified Streptomyces TaxID=2593676 RepID=UPI00093FC7A6|nr:ATP-binding protein [Streptomyces sp. TSRI0281]OKI34306.1 two-component sensor histidine kinase [Streptomyces sp. TSRI0281]
MNTRPQPRLRRRPWPQPGERLRLTLLYTGLLLLAGGGLITLVYVLLLNGLHANISNVVKRGTVTEKSAPDGPATEVVPQDQGAAELASTIEQAALHRLLVVSLIALTAFAAVSVLLAWWMAGRVLRPVAVITDTAQRLSAATLHERIALDAPPGELKRLADTFDSMLDRMEQLVSAQRRFAANAAHELRTPLARQRSAAEIGLAGDPTPAQVAYIRGELVKISEHSQQLIDGLLLLAASERGLERYEPVRVHELAATVANALTAEATKRDVVIDLTADPLHVEGDPVLLEHLVHNLVSNAVRYNTPAGTVTIRTGADCLQVSNTGPIIPPATVPRLFEPFHRMAERRQAPSEGMGLGLSIVAAIARAHGTQAHAEANPDGGLTIKVPLPTTSERGRTGDST